MKKFILILTGAALLFAGCTKEVDQEVVPAEGKRVVTLKATINDTNTRINLNSEGKYSWQSGDKIAVMVSNGTTQTCVESETSGSGATADFPVELEEGEELGAYAFYPCTDDYLFEGFEPNFYLSDWLDYEEGVPNIPMLGTISQDGVSFSAVCGGLKLTINNVPSNATSLVFSVDDISITGEFSIHNGVITTDGQESNCQVVIDFENQWKSTMEFFIPLPTGTYNGFGLTFMTADADDIGTRTTNATLVVDRNKIIVAPELNWGSAVSDKYYVKVTSNEELMNGTYLIVYEGGTSNGKPVPAVAFNGSLETPDAANNGVAVTIADNKILSTTTLNESAFSISIDGGTIQSASGVYVGVNSYGNGLATSDEPYVHSISIDNTGHAQIALPFPGGNMSLKYNYAADQLRFRYFKSGQQSIALYLLDDGSATSPSVKQEAGIEYAEGDKSFTITLGDSFTAPTLLNPNGLDVTYATSAEGVASVVEDGEGEGTVTINGAGTVTITASSVEQTIDDVTYKAGTASYTIQVNAPAVVHGSVDEPLGADEIVSIIDGLTAGEPTSDFYYVEGIVSVASSGIYSGKLSFTFGDDENDIRAYNCLGLDGAVFTSKDDVAVGDYVVVYGNLEKYVKDNKVTYEVVNGQLAKQELAPYFTANASPLTFESTGGNAVLSIAANVPWTATINNGGSLKIGDASASASVSGTADTEVTVIIPENANGATYTISFTTTSDKVSAPADIEIEQDPYVELVTAEALFTAAKSGGMATASNSGTSGTRRNVTASLSGGGKTDTDIRVYKNATLTLSVPTGAFITGIELTGTSSNPVSGFGSMTGFTTNGDNGSWSGSSQSVTFTASGAQVRLTQIDVTYRIAEDQLVNYTPVIRVTSSNPMSIANTAGSQTITYTIDDAPANSVLTDVSRSNDASWISNINYSTSGTVTFDVAAQENGAQARSASLTLKYTGAVDVPVTIIQAAGPTQGGEGTLKDGSVSMTYGEENTGWTISGTGSGSGGGGYYILCSNAFIESPSFTFNTIKSIVIKTRTAGGNTYKTTTIDYGTSNLGSIDASGTSLANKTLTITSSPAAGTGSIKFYSTTSGTSTQGPGIQTITINYDYYE